MKFRRVFVYILIIVSVAAICYWVVKPPAGENPPPSSSTIFDLSIDPSFDWIGWLTASLTAIGTVLFSIFYTRLFYRQKRAAEHAFSQIAKESLKELTDPNLVPVEHLARLLDSLRQHGFTDLGKYEAPYPSSPPTVVWALNSPERDVRAIGFMRTDIKAPTIALSTTFQDFATVESHYPSFILVGRQPDQSFMLPISIGTAINKHMRRAAKLSAAHGEPLKVSTLSDYFELVQRGVKHSDTVGSRKYRMQVPIFVVGGLIVLAAQVGVLLLPPDGVPLVCVGGTWAASVALLRLSYLMWKQLREK